MIEYSLANAPLQKELYAGDLEELQRLKWFCIYFFLIKHDYWIKEIDETDEVGNTAAFLASPLASAITGAIIYVDNGLNAMGVGVDSPIFEDLNIPGDKH